MTQDNTHIDDLIIRVLSGEAAPEERHELTVWMAQNDANRKYFRHRSELWFSSVGQRQLRQFDGQRAFERFRRHVGIVQERKQSGKWILRWAAAALMVLGLVGLLAYEAGVRQTQSRLTSIVVEAPLGSTSVNTLPDGTRVWLNAGSKLVYAQDFGVEKRDVRIEGEAYFEVKHNASLPFTVVSRHVKVEVLGTKFNVSDYDNDPIAQVSLNEGKVRFTPESGGSGILLPNEMMAYDKRTRKWTTGRCTASSLSMWTDAMLIYNNEPLERIVQQLNRYYRFNITFANNRARKLRFTGTFDRKQQSLHEILSTLSCTRTFRYRMKGRNIQIE